MLNNAWALFLALSLHPAPAAQPASAIRSTDRPITHVFQNLGHDIKALPSARSAGIVVAGVAGGWFAHSTGDQDVANWAARQTDAEYADAGMVMGDGWVQGGLALTTYAIGAIGHQARVAHIGSDLIRAQLLNGLLTTGLKISVDRTRPSGGTHGFPSGHTSAAFATAAVLDGHYGWKAGVPAYALAGFIGWTRVRDHVHFLSDVVIGSAIGTVVGRTVTSGHRARSWSIAPAPTPSGAGIVFLKNW